VALVAWQAAGTLWIHPHYLAFFNEVAGGPKNGWRHLVDSNLDWGQDLPGVKRWMAAHGVEKVWLSYFGTAPPEHYGIDYEPLPSFLPLGRTEATRPMQAGDYVVVSATNLHGVYVWDAPPEFLSFVDFLRATQTPVAIIGHSIFIYQLR
jgi:hypothetical protein